jgi:uncharacterized flavoprotein (TIGR03862 family)
VDRLHAPRVVVIGGGPAGLMAAEAASTSGAVVDVFEGMASPGRKFLLAGKGGLNLTHSDPFARFVAAYGSRADVVAGWLRAFDADALRAWARSLGVETFVGSSGRVFPSDLKAAPLLRAWLRRLRAAGVAFHMRHRWLGWRSDGALRFATADGEHVVQADALVLALGGGSWPQLGSDGRWVGTLREGGVPVVDLVPSNCGFDVAWSPVFAARHAGAPLKRVNACVVGADGTLHARTGECVVTAQGIEGQLIYALSAPLRERLAAGLDTDITFDLSPQRGADELAARLARPHGSRSLAEHWRRNAGVDGVRAGLLHEVLGRDGVRDAARVAAALKALPVRVLRPRPLAEAISTAGGVGFAGLDEPLMLRARPGVFCAGEMVDWEAPTGGYLLTACFASGRLAGAGAARWARENHGVRPVASRPPHDPRTD